MNTSEQPSPSELEKAIEVIEQFENTMELDGITRIAFQKIKSAAKRVKELEEHLKSQKQISFDKNEQYGNEFRLRKELEQQLRAKDELIERLVEAFGNRLLGDLENACNSLNHLYFINKNPKSVAAGFGPHETFKFWEDNMPKAMNELKKAQEALSLAHSQGYGKEKG